MREALFSSIEAWCGSLQGLRFLDLYAGSGAVGLEAWSRGAGVVTLVESDRRTARLIGENAKVLGFAKADVVAGPVTATLSRPPGAPYDVAFLDPPYPLDEAAVGGDLALLVAAALAGPGRHGRGGALVAQPGADLARRHRRAAQQALRRDHALVRSRRCEPRGPPGDLMRRAVCPGSFDPVTNGHLDIVQRASGLFDEVIVAVGVNVSKNRLFTAEERLSMLEQGVVGLGNVRVEGFTGLITTYCREADAVAIVKGLRSGTDFDYELQMAQMNAHLTGVETVFVPANPQYGVRVLQPDQGGRVVRRRRLRPGARLRARPAHRAARPAKGRVATPARAAFGRRRSGPRTILDWICLPGYRK